MSVVDDVKTVVSLVQKLDNAALYTQILELQTKVQGLYMENMDLRQALADKERKLELEDDVYFQHGAYWKNSNNDGPYCVPCWDDKRKLMRLTPTSFGGVSCNICHYMCDE